MPPRARAASTGHPPFRLVLLCRRVCMPMWVCSLAFEIRCACVTMRLASSWVDAESWQRLALFSISSKSIKGTVFATTEHSAKVLYLEGKSPFFLSGNLFVAQSTGRVAQWYTLCPRSWVLRNVPLHSASTTVQSALNEAKKV